MQQHGIIVILSGFPRRSETFALNELLALEKRGLLAAIFATKSGDGLPPHPDCTPLLNKVHFLPPGSPSAQANWLVQFWGNRPLAGIHAYFAHLPAEVAILAARQLHVPYGFSTHALDARKIPASQLEQRARNAVCVVACNRDVIKEFNGSAAHVHLLRHGVNTRRFYPTPFPVAPPLQMLAVGRFVEKKGFDILIAAAAQLTTPFQLRIVGHGLEQERLTKMIAAANLEDRVQLGHSQTHATLPLEYSKAHIVIVPSIKDQNGDRDGLPNVVLEAMACGRPIIASNVGDIANVVKPGKTGLLVSPGNINMLAQSITLLAKYPDLRQQLGRNGRFLIEQQYDVNICSARFCDLLADTYIHQPVPVSIQTRNPIQVPL